MKEHLKHCKHTVFHPIAGFEEVKWNGKGSNVISFVVLFLFFLVNVLSAQLTGFSFNTNNPDNFHFCRFGWRRPLVVYIQLGGQFFNGWRREDPTDLGGYLLFSDPLYRIYSVIYHRQ